MARCDYDIIFYRVFCLTLLGIAFIFTVILTNVFVDIDGLLSRNDKVKMPFIETTHKMFINPSRDPKSDMMYREEDNYDDQDELYRSKRSLEPKVLIKNIVDVKSQNDNVNQTSPKDVKGIIELIYNGKPVKNYGVNNEQVNDFKIDPRLSTDIYQNYNIAPVLKAYKTNAHESLEHRPDNIEMSKSFVTKVIKEYLKKYNINNVQSTFNTKSIETTNKLSANRMKRQIKIKYNIETTNQTKEANATKNNDDELYIEIESHFDGKGMKGEKKKKLIRQLIDKIQRAIHPESTETNKTKKFKHVQVKKRVQNPLDLKHQTMFIHKDTIPLATVIHRNIEPIEKYVAREESVHIRDEFRENWEQPYAARTSLIASKSVDSGKLGEVDTNYNTFMNLNAIPQRFQIPLNTDTSGEMSNSKYFNTGNMKFIIKDIDGSGFSVGFNKYTDAAPDSEAIKLFTGVENLIKAYHRKYDQASSREYNKQNYIMGVLDKNYEYMDNSAERHNMLDGHTIIRRSVKKENSHFNRFILDFQHLRTKKYKKKSIVMINKDKLNNVTSNNKSIKIKHFIDKSKIKILPLIINDAIFDQDLKPKEMYSLAALFERKKRTVALKNYSNLKSKKIKVNRFLNTKKKASKRIFINKKRNKRNIGRIEVISSDDVQKRQQSDEHIFVLSNEGMLADRATIREIETPEDLGLIDQVNKKESHYDFIPSIDSQPNLPFTYIPLENPLMSKYPHIFTDGNLHTYDDLIPEVFDKLRTMPVLNTNQDQSRVIDNNNGFFPIIPTTENYIPTAERNPTMEEIVNAISPNSPETKYKFTVKIIPNKNVTDLNGGFKEIHTSINKTYNKDGLMYSTLVNMSEISKIEDLFKLRNTTKRISEVPELFHLKREQQKIQSIIKNHKDRIEQQLNHLQQEKAHLEKMMAKHNGDANDYVDIMLPSNPPENVHLKSSDVNKLAASALMTLQKQRETRPTTPETTTSVSTTTSVTTTTTRTTISPERFRIIETIEKNDNLTKEILNKINKNTEMLKIFLFKLSNSITKLRHQENQTDSSKTTVSSSNKNDGHTHEPELVFAKPKYINTTNYRIPFLYAYQQPYGLVNKPDVPMASIVYKGHIHANTMGRPSEPVKNNNEIKMKANSDSNDRGRFFIDGIETGYREITRNNTSNNGEFIQVNNTVPKLV